MVLLPAANWAPSRTILAWLAAGIPPTETREVYVPIVFPFAVSVSVPVGPAPMLGALTVTVRVVDAAEGIEALDRVPATVVLVLTTVNPIAALELAL